MQKDAETPNIEPSESRERVLPSEPKIIAYVRPYNESDPNAPTAGVLIEFVNREAKRVRMITPSGELTANPRKVHLEIGNRGFVFADADHAKQIVQRLAAQTVTKHIGLTKVPGWHGDCYVLPDELIFPEGGEEPAIHFERNSLVKLGAYVQRGTLAGWQKEVASAAKYSTRIRLFIASGFAAATLWRMGAQSFGIVLMGLSSKGKTLSLRTGASVAGMLGYSGLTTFSGSLAALEQQLLGHRDAFCPLDEIGAIEGSPKQVAGLLKAFTFSLVSGSQRERAKQYELAVSAVKSDTRFIVGMTTETSLAAIARSAEVRRVRGEEVRILELNAYGPSATDIFDTKLAGKRFGADKAARGRYAEALERACEANQGVALRAFMRRLVNDRKATSKLLDAVQEFRIAASATRPLETWEARIAKHIAAVYAAAKLAIQYKVLDWNERATRAALLQCLADILHHHAGFEQQSAAEEGSEPADDQLIERFLDYVKKPLDLGKKSDWKKGDLPTGARRAPVLKVTGAVEPRTRLLARAAQFKEVFPATVRARLLKALEAESVLVEGKRDDTAIHQLQLAPVGSKRISYYVFDFKAVRTMRKARDK